MQNIICTAYANGRKLARRDEGFAAIIFQSKRLEQNQWQPAENGTALLFVSHIRLRNFSSCHCSSAPLVQTFDFVSIPLSLPQIKRIKPQRQQNNVFMSFTEHSACACRWESRRAAKRSRSRGWTHAQLLRVAALRTPPSSSISPSPLALMKTDASRLLCGNAAFWLVGSEAAVFLEFSLAVCFSSPHLTSPFSFVDLIGRSYEL